MGHFSVIILFGILSTFFGYACVNGSKKRIKQIGYHKKYFPKEYTVPNIIVRRLFGLEKKMIPKGLYLELLMVFPMLLLFVIASIVYLIYDVVFLIRYR